LIRSYQNISNLGFFQQPLPFPDTRPANDQGDVDVIFRVTEKHTGNINFGASVGQGTGVGGFLGLDEPNLFGQGKKGHFQWQFGKNISDFAITYTDPAIRESRISGTVDVHNTRLRYTIADLGTLRRRGGGVQYGIPLRGYDEFSVTPHGYDPSATNGQATAASFGKAYLVMTGEVGARLSQMFYVSAFFDAGNVWARAGEFDPTRLFRGAGL